jgi:hypothetical protein
VEINLWLERWEHDCCGEPFAVGSAVAWTGRWPATGLDWLTPQLPVAIDAAAGRHANGAPWICGVVRSIEAVHLRFDPEPVPGSATRTPVGTASRRREDDGDRQFAGYLIRLRVIC